MATNPAPLPELVQDLEIEGTTFQDDVTIHTKLLGRRRRIEKWKPRKILGRGGYGVVWLEHRVEGGTAAQPFYRAVKVFHTHGRGPGHYVRELEALAKFTQHKYSDYFVEFLGWYENPKSGCLHIAMEYCPHGDLESHLAEHGGRLPEEEVKDIMSHVLAGIVMMHRAGLANRDIKPANILIKSKPPDGHWWVKICDFGLSERAKDHFASTIMTVIGTPGFMPPEMLRCSPDTGRDGGFMADMWCFGETVFRALTGEPVFKGEDALMGYYEGSLVFPFQTLHHVNASTQAISFIKSLMKASPHERMTSKQANKHPWITTMKEVSYDPEAPQMTAMVSETPSQYTFPKAKEPGDQLTPPSGQWSTKLTPPSRKWSTKLTPPSGQWSTTLTSLNIPVLQQQGGSRSGNPRNLQIIADLRRRALLGGNVDAVLRGWARSPHLAMVEPHQATAVVPLANNPVTGLAWSSPKPIHPHNTQGPDAQSKAVYRGSRAPTATSRTRIIHSDSLIPRPPHPGPRSGHSHSGRNLHPHLYAPTPLRVIQSHPPSKRMGSHGPGRFRASRFSVEVSSTWEDEAKIEDIEAHFQWLEQKAEGLRKGKLTTGRRTKYEKLKEYAETFKLYPVLDRVDEGWN